MIILTIINHIEQELEWERMLTEVEALMELTHPNIVRLHEYYRDDDALYLVEVWELCSGPLHTVT